MGGSSNGGHNWLNPRDNNLWQGVNETNNPCPEGFRLPREAEWEEEKHEWASSNTDDAFASILKLTTAGYRHWEEGALRDVGSKGNYQSATFSGKYVRNLVFSSAFNIIPHSGARKWILPALRQGLTRLDYSNHGR